MRFGLPQLRESLTAFKEVFANPSLRRIQLGLVGSTLGGWAYGIALSVYAFETDGAYAVGLIALVRCAVAAAAAPFVGVVADRFARTRVMISSDLAGAACMVGMAASVAADAPLAVYGLSMVLTVTGAAFRPAQAALLPSLARTPSELTASNVASSTIEGFGIFAGPALGGLVFAFTGAEVVFLVSAATYGWSALNIARIRPDAPPEKPEQAGPTPKGHFGGELLAGVSLIARDPRLRVLGGLYTAQTFVDGALGVLLILLALETLDVGASGYGVLNAAAGVGAILGAVVAGARIGRGRLGSDFLLGLGLWGMPVVAIALWPSFAAAFIALAVVGIGNTLVDVAGNTLLQRLAPDEVRARVFAALDGLMYATVGLGAIVAPLLVEWLGTRTAFALVGAVLPVLAVLSRRRLAALNAEGEAHRPDTSRLETIPIFAPLPAASLEQLASRLQRHSFPAGTRVVVEGDPGDDFYIVSAGALEVERQGEVSRRLGPGDWFGEIALLREVPRTATVTAVEDVELYSLGRDDFVPAVLGHAGSFEAANQVITGRLGPVR